MPPLETHINKSLELSHTDLNILESLSVKGYRFLTCKHLCLLYGFSFEECLHTMDKLCSAGLVMRVFLPTTEMETPEPIYTLTRIGARELARLQHSSTRNLIATARKPSYFFLEHSLKIASFMCSLISALNDSSIKLRFWQSEYNIRSSRRKALMVPDPYEVRHKIPIIPDGLFALEKDGVIDYYFLEADRGTMPIVSIRKKMLGYMQFFRKELHTNLFNVPHFRVLFVTTTPYRRDQARSALREIGHCPNMFLFGLWNNVTHENILGSIWLTCRKETLFSILD